MTQPAANGQRIGVLGGTFDPIHIGHLVTGLNVRHELGLDVVLYIVAHDPWQKADRDITPSEIRLRMAREALEGREGLVASDLEIRRGGVSLTADTLGELRATHPGAELFLIVGQDQAGNLDTWERVEEIRELATLAFVRRPGSEGEEPPAGWRAVAVDVPLLQVSSSDLRRRFAEGRPVDWLTPDPVVRIVAEHGLYASGG